MDFNWLPKCLHWPFCPGVFIAILAFMAAAVTFRREPGTREKATWTFLFLALMCAEVWMMSKDREANENQQTGASAAQLKGFEDIGNGIKDAIAQSDRNFSATMGKTNQVLLNITGGDSFAYVSPQPGGEAIPLVVWNHGDQPLIGVTMTIARTQDPDWGVAFFQPIFIGTIGPHDHAPVPRVIVPRPEEKSGIDHYWIMLSAQNGTVSQTLDFRKNKKTGAHQPIWATSFQVTKPEILTRARGPIPKGATLMKPLMTRGWSDEVQESPKP
jgi:hypothetical protein